MQRLSSFLPILIVVLWLLLVVAGMQWLTEYANRPGDAGQPDLRWARPSSLPLSVNLPTLVMFAHPRCPCTRASINELAVLMAQCEGKLSAKVVFCQPLGTEPGWSRTDLWFAASRIPNVDVFSDADGSELRQFGAATSGQVLLYDTDGELLFQGGITSSRGHAGDNLGRSSILQLIRKAPRPRGDATCHVKTPVFGCPLLD